MKEGNSAPHTPRNVAGLRFDRRRPQRYAFVGIFSTCLKAARWSTRFYGFGARHRLSVRHPDFVGFIAPTKSDLSRRLRIGHDLVEILEMTISSEMQVDKLRPGTRPRRDAFGRFRRRHDMGSLEAVGESTHVGMFSALCSLPVWQLHFSDSRQPDTHQRTFMRPTRQTLGKRPSLERIPSRALALRRICWPTSPPTSSL